MLTGFFSAVRLVTLDTLPSGTRFNQESFIQSILLDIIEARGRTVHRFGWREFSANMDSSMSYNRCKMTDEFDNLTVDRIGLSKSILKDRVFQTVEEMMITFHSVSNELTLNS
jgi:hypothetical protein